jgi:hypothetical protein
MDINRNSEMGFILMVLLCATMDGIAAGSYFQGLLYPAEVLGVMMFFTFAVFIFTYYWVMEAERNRFALILTKRGKK